MAKVNGRRDEIEITDRRRKVARLLAKKITQVEIAKELGVSQPTISRDVVAIEEEWKREYSEALELIRARELAELRDMERDAAAAFAKTRDPRFLQARLATKTRIAKLVGLDAPERREVEVVGDDRIVLLDALLDGGDEEDASLPASH